LVWFEHRRIEKVLAATTISGNLLSDEELATLNLSIGVATLPSVILKIAAFPTGKKFRVTRVERRASGRPQSMALSVTLLRDSSSTKSPLDNFMSFQPTF
jgi:hypothetical protein